MTTLLSNNEGLSSPVRKYLSASARVSRDAIYSYETAIEIVLVELMEKHLQLDPSWPHQTRWLDGLNEEFSWERKNGILYGRGELFWGHWPEVSREITGARFTAMLTVCSRHGIEYRLVCENDDRLRTFSTPHWCS